MNESKYDKRLISKGLIPPGYDDYLKSLKCCVCGSIEPCECTIEDFEASHDKPLNSTC
jgi:hypothetical protein